MLVPVVIALAAVVMIVIEMRRPGRRWPQVAGWLWRSALLNIAQVAVVFIFGFAWEAWLAERRLFSADRLGVTGGAIAGYLVITFTYYWWHRWRHESIFLWRWFHQIHH